jgi:hypothetical protein
VRRGQRSARKPPEQQNGTQLHCSWEDEARSQKPEMRSVTGLLPVNRPEIHRENQRLESTEGTDPTPSCGLFLFRSLHVPGSKWGGPFGLPQLSAFTGINEIGNCPDAIAVTFVARSASGLAGHPEGRD